MIEVKYKLKNSPIHGIGLFSLQDIKKGAVVFSSDPRFESSWTEEESSNLNPLIQKYIFHYGLFNSDEHRYHLNHDDIRFCNHSTRKNNITLKKLDKGGYKLIAIRDIKSGEELLQDYNELEKPLRKELK